MLQKQINIFFTITLFNHFIVINSKVKKGKKLHYTMLNKRCMNQFKLHAGKSYGGG